MYTNEILANQTASIVGVHVALEAFMKDDVNLLINAFTAHGIHPKKAETFLRNWSYDHVASKTSNFAANQMELLHMANTAGIVTPDFLMNMVTSPAYIGEGDYGNLALLDEEVKKTLENINMSKSTQRTM